VSGEDASPATGGGAAGDEAAWRELVARYDTPADWEEAEVPWPEREDLAGPPSSARVIRPAVSPQVPDPAADLTTDKAGEDDDTEEHFVPPPPPPLPHLDPVAKGAWTALFGGPAYLLVATLAGWVVPSWAALLAIVAFVGGFAVLLLRLGDGPSRGSGPDNGAVL
jgi:hypothetical protein